MAKTLIQSVVKQLEQERARLEDQLHRVTVALTTFGKVYMYGKNADLSSPVRNEPSQLLDAKESPPRSALAGQK